MKRLAKWIGRVKDATLNDQWFMLAMVCAAAGVFGFYGYVALDRWLFKRAANAIVQGMERYALTNGFKILHNTFEVETHSHATNTEWFDYASRELQRRELNTDEQAVERLLGYKPVSKVSRLKTLMHLRDLVEISGVGKEFDAATDKLMDDLINECDKRRRVESAKPKTHVEDFETGDSGKGEK